MQLRADTEEWTGAGAAVGAWSTANSYEHKIIIWRCGTQTNALGLLEEDYPPGDNFATKQNMMEQVGLKLMI